MTLGESAKAASSWPIFYRAEILSRVIDADHNFSYTAPNEAAGGRIAFKLARTSYFFKEMPESERLKYAMDLYKIIFSYVFGDSANRFSDISLYYYQVDDTLVHLLYTHGPTLKDSLVISDIAPEDRFILLANIIPFKCLAVSNPSERYKKRLMGFSLPARLGAANKEWDDISRGNYASALASLMFDFVLRRNDELVAKLVVQFSDDNEDLTTKLVAESIFPMDSRFIRSIKEQNVMMFYHPDSSFSQPISATDVGTRLAAISFLAQGHLSYWYDAPEEGKKGRCVFDYYCKGKKDDHLFISNPYLFTQYLANIVIDYCIGERAKDFDSVTIRLFDNRSNLLSGMTFSANQRFHYTTEDDRMGLLLNILPFTGQAHFGDSEFEVDLREIPGCSPNVKLGTYVAVLSLAIYEYVFRRQKKTAAVSIRDKKGVGNIYYPAIESCNAAIRYLQVETPKR